MLVEIGVQNVAKVITVETDESADTVNKKVNAALNGHDILILTDKKGRTVTVPSTSLGYVIIGSESTHPVGFGSL